jgi:hypothetical protein
MQELIKTKKPNNSKGKNILPDLLKNKISKSSSNNSISNNHIQLSSNGQVSSQVFAKLDNEEEINHPNTQRESNITIDQDPEAFVSESRTMSKDTLGTNQLKVVARFRPLNHIEEVIRLLIIGIE